MELGLVMELRIKSVKTSFRCFENASVSGLGAINVLIGANNSGNIGVDRWS